jgi:hypothetical protein
LFICGTVCSSSNKDVGLNGWVVDPIIVGKESFPGDKLSGHSTDNTPITGLQPVGRIEEAGYVKQSMGILRNLGFDSDFNPEASNSLVLFASKIADHAKCPSSLIPYTLQIHWY